MTCETNFIGLCAHHTIITVTRALCVSLDLCLCTLVTWLTFLLFPHLFTFFCFLLSCLFAFLSSHLGLNPHIFMQAISVVSHLRRTCGWADRTEKVQLTQVQQIAMAQTVCQPVFNNELSIYSILFISAKPW